ncbi:MAG: CoA activase [Planctomycetes bacterium]|nr:CoA activase [Planctomycetota bacterium]
MLSCGIDVGARTVKVVVLENGRIRGRAIRVAGLQVEDDVAAALKEAAAGEVRTIVATGSGREAVKEARQRPTGITCAARGIHFLLPEARMVIDVGAEEGRAIQCEGGRALNFAVNEKCAAGAGTFIETMSRTLEIAVDGFGPLALQSTKLVPMNAQCAVFAESEVVSLIHEKTPKQDIARAVCDAMAGRIGSMCRRLAITPPVALVGGVAKNTAFVRALENDLKTDLTIPPDAEYVSAIGAALIAAEEH